MRGRLRHALTTNAPIARHGKVADAALIQIALGELAQKKASSSEVKQFAQRMIDDHRKSYEELLQIVAKYGETLPKELGELNQGEVKRLAWLSGDEFDRGYAHRMVANHQQTMVLFRQGTRKAEAPELRIYAEKKLPVVEQYFKMARSLPGPKQP